MNHTSDEQLTFTMPLTLKAHQIANQFRQQQSSPEKGKQVYLNTLAVQAVHSYLSWLGITTDLEVGNSWNPAMQALEDTGDLVVPGKGRLECRPVLPAHQSCFIPPEVWAERIGYVAVQFNSDLSEATLRGFVPTVSQLELPLSQWRSLDALLDAVTLEAKISAIPSIHLSQWFQGTIETGWQRMEDLLGWQQPAWSFRSGDTEQSALSPTTQGKLLDLLPELDGNSIVLLVGVLPGESLVDIWVKVCPAKAQLHLPPNLEVLVLDEADIPVMQAQSRDTEMIQLKFKGTPGEKFSVKVILGKQSITEFFVV